MPNLFSTRVLWFAAFVRLVGASCFPNLFFSKVSSPFLLQFILENSPSSILREPYSLSWYEFLINAYIAGISSLH